MMGYIKLYRKSYVNFLYKENRPHTKREAWEDILMHVNYEDSMWTIGNQQIECKRGQSLMSLESWGKIFNWDKSKVKRFFETLKSATMIETQNERKTTRLTVLKYEDYQGDRNAKRTQIERKTKPIKEEKNDKNYISVIFDVFRQEFKGTKRGLKTELENFLKKNDPEIVHLLLPALEKEKQHKAKLLEFKEFVPSWPMLSTWINNKRWEQELSEITQIYPKPVINQKSESDMIDPELKKRLQFQSLYEN